MPWRRWCKRLVVLGCLGLLQCSVPQPVPMHSAFDDVPRAIAIDPQFRDGLGRLTSIQSWPMASGDNSLGWLLLGVKVQWDGQQRVWFVRVAEIIDPEEAEGGRLLRTRRFEYTVPFGVGAIMPNAKFNVRCRRVRIETYDERGEFIAAWSRLAPEVFPEASMFEALATLPNLDPTPRPQDVALGVAMMRSDSPMDSDEAMTCVQALRDRGLYETVATLQALGTTPPVKPIRDAVKEHVVAMPSIISLLLTGLKPTVSASMRAAATTEFPWAFDRAAVPCYQAEFATLLAGDRFLDCRIVAGPSVPPMDLLGGLLMIEAAHPRQPENRLTVRVLASSVTPPPIN